MPKFPIPANQNFPIAKVGGKLAGRLIPGIGWAITAVEIYGFYQLVKQFPNPYKWERILNCNAKGPSYWRPLGKSNCTDLRVPVANAQPSAGSGPTSTSTVSFSRFWDREAIFIGGVQQYWDYHVVDSWTLRSGQSSAPVSITAFHPSRPHYRPYGDPAELPIRKPAGVPLPKPSRPGKAPKPEPEEPQEPRPGNDPDFPAVVPLPPLPAPIVVAPPAISPRPRPASRPAPKPRPVQPRPQFPPVPLPPPFPGAPAPSTPPSSGPAPRPGGSPRPRPRPGSPPSKGTSQGGEKKRPRKGEKESKVNVRSVAGTGWLVFNATTEGLDFFFALFEALPEHVKKKYGPRPSKAQMSELLFDYWEEIDLARAIEEYFNNAFEDFVFGSLGKLGTKATQGLGITTGLNKALRDHAQNINTASQKHQAGPIKLFVPQLVFNETSGEFEFEWMEVGATWSGSLQDLYGTKLGDAI